MENTIASQGLVDVVRAWKDEEYRAEVSHQPIDIVPPNPAGELSAGLDSGLEERATDGSCSCYPLHCT
jgi:mersacidin/lichenicidin family type 2 lantibiotic